MLHASSAGQLLPPLLPSQRYAQQQQFRETASTDKSTSSDSYLARAGGSLACAAAAYQRIRPEAVRQHKSLRRKSCPTTNELQITSELQPLSGPLRGSAFLWQVPLTLPAPFPASVSHWLPKHSVVLAECDPEAGGGFAAFDFEPQRKEAIDTAIQLLSGASVPGRFGVRRLKKLPAGAVRVGLLKEGVTVDLVTGPEGLNKSADARLSLSANDCNAYASSVLKLILQQPVAPTGQRLYSTLAFDADGNSSLEPSYKEPSLFSAVVLVAGTTVGAGILALPAVTQKVGFLPSSGALFLCWLYMAATGLLIAEAALADMAASGKPATSLQSMASRTIGPLGATLSSASFVIVHFGLLVAYISRGGELLSALLPGLAGGVAAPIVFAGLFGGLIFLLKGSDVLEALNNVFATVVLVSFVALVALALPMAEPVRLVQQADWSSTPDIIPTLLLSLVYHNVVPTICAQLEGDRGKITLAVVGGSFLPFLMFLIWNGVILSAVPPSTMGVDPLEVLRSSGASEFLGAGVLAFSLSAIVTSFIGFVLALTDFFKDALRPAESTDADSSDAEWKNRSRDFALTLLPPLAIACYDPTLFFQAIDKAGAFGVSMLFGFLPAWMALAQRASEMRVLVQNPGFIGGYERGALVPGGLITLVLVAGGALAVVADNLLELVTS